MGLSHCDCRHLGRMMSNGHEATCSKLLNSYCFCTTVVGIGGTLFALQQFAGINGILYFSSSNFLDAGVTNSVAASALVGLANLTGN